MTLPPGIFKKMTITCTEENDDGLCIIFDWDDTDPVFEPWAKMTEHEKRDFVLTSISNQLKKDFDVAS